MAPNVNRQSMLSHHDLENITDLASLPTISDDIIVSCLRERFLSDNIYTRIGSSAIVALNPHKYVPSNSDAILHKYAAEYRDTAEGKTPLPPHIFQLANNAYYHMRRTTQDQAILLSGETGSGKSESRRLAVKSLLELSVSSPGKKGAKLATQIPAAEFVLECFGNAKTLFNPNASRFGKYTELQFTERGRLCGMKSLDYYLERSRVSGAPSGERNFHVFYYLVAGASSEERQHLHLSEKTTYRYLGPRGAFRPAEGQEDDATRFDQLKVAMKNVGLSKRQVAQTCQLLAAIIHLGNLEFTVDRSQNEDAAVVRNNDVLEIVADFLGVVPAALENVLSCKVKMVNKELCTVFLDSDGASDNRDDLAKMLYSLLFTWLNECINARLTRDDFSTFIGIVDIPGSQNMPTSTSRMNSLDQFCVNFANERLHNWMQKRLFESHVEEYMAEGISDYVPRVPYFDNSECLRLLSTMPGGLIHIMDDQARRAPKKTDHSMVQAFQKRWGNHNSFKSGSMDRSGFPTFTISHYNGPVTYSSDGFLERNLDSLNPDFVRLLRGATDGASAGTEGTGSANPFIRDLFSSKAIATRAHPKDVETIVSAAQPQKPMRAPSTRRKGTIKRRGQGGQEDEEKDDDDAPSTGGASCVAGEFRSALDTLFATLDETQPWYAFCVNPNDQQLPNQLEGRSVKGQVKSMGLSEIAKRCATIFEANMSPQEFCDRYKDQLEALGIHYDDPRQAAEASKMALGLQDRDIVLGAHQLYLSQNAFHKFEDHLRANDSEEHKRNRAREADEADTRDPYAPYASPGGPPSPQTGYGDPFNQSSQALPLVANAAPLRGELYNDEYEQKSFYDEEFDGRSRYTSARDETTSNLGTESYAPSRNMFQNVDATGLLGKEALPGEMHEGETVEQMKETSTRRRWVLLCWLLTWWVPDKFLEWFGRMKRLDVRQAWREKLALNIIIWFVCACAAFVIAVLGLLICPTQHVFSQNELSQHSFKNDPNNAFTSIRGEVFDLSSLVALHQRTVAVVSSKSILNYAGTSADNIFPVQVSALCNGISGSISPYVTLDSTNDTDPNAQYHDFRAFTNDSRPDWYFESMTIMRWKYRVGFVGYTTKQLKNMANTGSWVGIYNGLVYDLTSYINNGPTIGHPSNAVAPSGIDTQFMHNSVLDVFRFNSGQDITKKIDSLNIDPDILARQKTCLRNLFTIGKEDRRNAPQCLFSTYILLALSVVMVSVIGFKFLAALSFSAPRAPEDHDKFIICQVPCYTEGEESMRKTIDSLARLKYDDKRKLIFIICDGNIVGSGNDRPTPRIVLDILGADLNNDPEPLSFLSLGEGAKQHNMGKVYSGLYECSGHVVPYIVVVKVGKPSERSRPGNRGKRDSQMILMRFLNKVHFNSPMNPLELEMYHQIKNVIGVNPSFYEYLFMVDADTTVHPMSVNRLVSAMIHDKRVLGVCGETGLSNSKDSIITMMQVYEYFISHHLAKAFESLFGSVTCLPGCFTMYRLRTPDTHKPLFISNQVIEDYSENRVDTLHTKNLLHLGEDRYLTTLLLKHFPLYKTQFVRDAQAWTVAPDEWKVLLSQRRRWINSTIHNLGELVFLDQLCGFCCFSMRFIVFIDLLSTVVQPITVAYIVYLIYRIVAQHESIPTFSLVMIAAIYGLQAIVFLLRRKWDMIGWMIFYILAIPAFSFFLPLYSFWKMDDFSWGATRVVLGESGKKVIVHDEGKFDPRSIPLKSWSDFENELWDKESNHSIGSYIPTKLKNEGYAESRTASLYGRETYYDPARSRSHSPVPSHLGMPNPPPGYHSGRNTPLNRAISPLRPMSEVSQPMFFQNTATRPSTNYLDVNIPGTQSPEAFEMVSNVPSDAEIEQAVMDILRGADLTTVTKKAVRQKLENMWGMDLTNRKGAINAAIDRVILSQS